MRKTVMHAKAGIRGLDSRWSLPRAGHGAGLASFLVCCIVLAVINKWGKYMEGNIVKDRLSILTWMIDRYDVLRVAIARRAAIVLSADAILVTATIFLFGQYHSFYLSGLRALSTAERNMTVVFILAVVSAIGLLSISILSATSSIVNVWTKSNEMPGAGAPQIYFFHARDTYDDFKNFAVFREKIDKTTDEDFLSYSVAELWRVIVATYHRHNDLKQAIIYLYWAIFPFIISLLIFSAMLMVHLFS